MKTKEGKGGSSHGRFLRTLNARSGADLLVAEGARLEPGKMYLRLYHGRTDPGQDMEDQGFPGPTFAPLSSYVQIYCNVFRVHGEHARELWLEKHADMIAWEGAYYGDMVVFVAGKDGAR